MLILGSQRMHAEESIHGSADHEGIARRGLQVVSNGTALVRSSRGRRSDHRVV